LQALPGWRWFGLWALLVSPFPAEELGTLANTGTNESPHALWVGMSRVGRTARRSECQWLWLLLLWAWWVELLA
jgi:hypothetical protein